MTTENIVPATPIEDKKAGEGCLGQLGWFFSGAVLPMVSLSYYRKAAQRSVASAILFFVIFTVMLSTFLTVSIAVASFSAIASIQESFESGEIPEIIISNGIAEVSGPQPYILVDGADSSGRQMFVGIDTTGEITDIDPNRYYQGFLLTRTDLHVISPQNGYQVLPLSELNAMFEKDPIIVNAQTMSQAWAAMSTILVIFAFIFLVIWHTIIRLMFISMIALVFWGIITLIKPNTGFGPVIISGLYAVVPAIYLSHLLSRSGFTFPGLQTFFLLVFWVLGLVVNFANVKFFTDERPLRLWVALIALPMLLLYIADLFWQFPDPYDLIALWVVTVLTVLVLIGVRLFFRFQAQKPEESPAEIN